MKKQLGKQIKALREECGGSTGEVYVFELKDGILRQISIGLETIEDANSFIETMKEGMYYKSIRPDCVLIAMQVLNFA